MTTYSIELFETPDSKETTNGVTYYTMSKAAEEADRLFNAGLYYEVRVINNETGQAWYTQKRIDTDEIESIFADIDNEKVKNMIDLYASEYKKASELPLSQRREERVDIITELDGYIQALEDLGIIQVEDRRVIKHYVRSVEA